MPALLLIRPLQGRAVSVVVQLHLRVPVKVGKVRVEHLGAVLQFFLRAVCKSACCLCCLKYMGGMPVLGMLVGLQRSIVPAKLQG